MKKIRTLIVEDESDKSTAISNEIRTFFGVGVEITLCDNFSAAVREIIGTSYDFIVVDLLLPSRPGDIPIDRSEEIVEHLSESALNKHTTVVAVSKFPDVVSQRRSTFSKSAIHLIGYQNEAEWKSCLRICMQRVSFATAYDFVIICALEKERSAYCAVHVDGFVFGEPFIREGLDCREIRIGELEGVCIKQPRMGLVDSSIIAAKSLQVFRPKVIAMSGICGGFVGKSPLGHLIVSEITWEHQAGKWDGDNFEIRTYQESLSNEVRTVLSQMLEEDPELARLASKKHEIQMPSTGGSLRPTVSGSSVVASKSRADLIKDQHDKLAGIDMEVFGVFRAAAIYGASLHCFAAKTVVDFSDEAKGDTLQEAGSILSARFTVNAMIRLFKELE